METINLTMKNSFVLFYAFAMSTLLLVADYFSGPFIQFPISYLIPVAYVSWLKGRRWGLIFAISMPLVRFYFNVVLWTVPWTTTEASINALIRIIVLSSFALIIDRTAVQTRKLAREVSLLEGLLPICSFCKKIRDQNDQWQVLEKYITDRTAASFTHGICPDCLQKHFPNVHIAQK
jgi:hypothetical protein